LEGDADFPIAALGVPFGGEVIAGVTPVIRHVIRRRNRARNSPSLLAPGSGFEPEGDLRAMSEQIG
jgi:hypothetical protein